MEEANLQISRAAETELAPKVLARTNVDSLTVHIVGMLRQIGFPSCEESTAVLRAGEDLRAVVVGARNVG